MIIYLDLALLRDSRGTFSDVTSGNTALHSGMDLAVSSSPSCPYSEAGPLAWDKVLRNPFELGRFCSHHSDYSGRVLPATWLPILPTEGGCKNEHPEFCRSVPRPCSGRSILQLPSAGKIGECSDFPLPISFERSEITKSSISPKRNARRRIRFCIC